MSTTDSVEKAHSTVGARGATNARSVAEARRRAANQRRVRAVSSAGTEEAQPVPGAVAAADAAACRGGVALRLPLIGRVELPPREHLAFYAGVGLLAAASIVDWPVAVVLVAGKALADNRTSQRLHDFGEALEHAV